MDEETYMKMAAAQRMEINPGAGVLGRRAGLSSSGPLSSPRLVDQAIQRVEEIVALSEQLGGSLNSNIDRNLDGGPVPQNSASPLRDTAPPRAGAVGHLLDRLDILHARIADALDMAQRLDNRL